MAQQDLNTGTTAGDGTGDGLRDSMIKVQSNTSELYSVGGWGFYVDDISSNTTITTTPSKLPINKLGATTSEAYLPLDIRGSGTLWDEVNSKITPINTGDSYDLRIDLTVASKTGSPTYLDLILDIGGGVSPSINIVTKTISLIKTPPYSISFGFPIFSLSTFISNGGQIFLSTDTGTVAISNRAIFIKRDFKGTI